MMLWALGSLVEQETSFDVHTEQDDDGLPGVREHINGAKYQSLPTVSPLNPMFPLVFSPSGGLGSCPGCCLDKSSFPTPFSISQCLCFLICLWRAAYFSL